MKNISREEKKGARKSYMEAKRFRFSDFLSKEIISRLNQLKKKKS